MIERADRNMAAHPELTRDDIEPAVPPDAPSDASATVDDTPTPADDERGETDTEAP